MAVDTGHGASASFSSTGGTWLARVIGETGKTLPKVRTSHLGTANNETYMAGDLADPKPIEIEILFQGSQGLPVLGTSETLTITHPTASGASTPATLAVSGFIDDTTYPNFQTNELQTGKIRFQPNGVTFSFTPAT